MIVALRVGARDMVSFRGRGRDMVSVRGRGSGSGGSGT